MRGLPFSFSAKWLQVSTVLGKSDFRARAFRELVVYPDRDRSHTNASLMVDARKPGTERGVTAVGKAEVITAGQSQEINRRVHSRYLTDERGDEMKSVVITKL